MILGRSLSLKFCESLILFIVIFFLFGCSGSGSGSASGPVVTGQALLGPLTGAEVDIYHYDDLNISIHSTITSESTKLADAGLFNIPKSVFEDNELYVIKISGGKDIDADDDGVLDTTPITNNGTLHLVADGRQLKNGSFKANILTDIVYKKIFYYIKARYPVNTIKDQIYEYSKALIKLDVDDDGDLDYNDLLAWDPVNEKDKVFQEWTFFQECITAVHNNIAYSDKLLTVGNGIVGIEETPDTAQALTVSGDYAFVADMTAGLQIMDISNPSNPERIGSVDTPGKALDIEVKRNYAFVADYTGGIHTVDISDPENPTIVYSLDTPGRASGITISGDYIFVADSSADIQMIDISDPSSPNIINSIDTPAWANDVKVAGAYAYVGTSVGLTIVDISNLEKASVVSTTLIKNSVRRMSLSGNFAYLACGDTGLVVVDISDPLEPFVVSTTEMLSNAKDVSISGNTAYVADSIAGVAIVNIDDPANPEVVGEIALEYINGVHISNKYVYAANNSGIAVLDTTRFSNDLGLIGHTDIPDYANGFELCGKYAYVAEGSGLIVIDLDNITKPSLVSDLYLGVADYTHLSVEGEHTYIFNGVLKVINITDPFSPSFIGSYATSFHLVTDIAVNQATVYATCSAHGLLIFDTVTPSNPELVNIVEFVGGAYGVVVNSEYAYTTLGSAGLAVIDVSNPHHPVITGSITNSLAGADKIALSGDHAFITDKARGFHVIDVKDPSNPVIIGSVEIPDLALDIVITRDYAFLANSASGVTVIDIWDPKKPFIVSVIGTNLSRANSVAVSDGYLFVLDTYRGLNIYRAIPSD